MTLSIIKIGNPHSHIAINFLILLSVVGGLAVFLQFRAALFQEKDTPDILRTALSMELSRTNVAVVNSNRNRLLVKSFSALKTHLEQQGWTWRDQLGAMIMYRKGDQNLNASCGMYSRNYMICDLSQVP